MTRLTQPELCAMASAAGYPASGEQFLERLKWGLIPPPGDDGRWSADAAKALIRAQQLWTEERVHQLPRRALRMRCEGFPIPDENVLDALRAVAPTIDQPSGKMKTTVWARQVLADPASITRKQKPKRRPVRVPSPSTWNDLLRRTTVEAVTKRFWVWCHVASALRSLPFRPEDKISDVPVEELVTLLAVQDLAVAQESEGF